MSGNMRLIAKKWFPKITRVSVQKIDTESLNKSKPLQTIDQEMKS
jgi:hypothetical protein